MKTIWKSDIELLSPLFCRGAYSDVPEIRPPSIRGMVRWWFRQLGGTPDEEKELFGGLNQFGDKSRGKVAASQVIFRVVASNLKIATPKPATLPHKAGAASAPQSAFLENGFFRLEVVSRFAALSDATENRLRNALDVWTLLGALGLRGNRGGGSLWPMNERAPRNGVELRNCLDRANCSWPVFLTGPETGDKLSELRRAASDTLRGPVEVFGSIKPRLPSPLKIKLVRMDGKLKLLVTARDERVLDKARDLLVSKPLRSLNWQEV